MREVVLVDYCDFHWVDLETKVEAAITVTLGVLGKTYLIAACEKCAKRSCGPLAELPDLIVKYGIAVKPNTRPKTRTKPEPKHPDEFACDLCERVFGSERGLRRHRQFGHGVEPG